MAGVSGLFTGFTRLSKALSFVLVVGYLVVTLIPSSLTYVALVPGKTIPFAWNLLTAGYIEKSAISLVLNVFALLFLGKSLEPVWGSREFFWFIVVVNTWTTFSTFVIMIILYYSTLNERFLYAPGAAICGFHGVVAGFLVGIKQLMPDQEITALVILKFRAKWLPSLFVLLSTAFCAVWGDAVQFLSFIVFGTYVSWIYLRFYQTKSEANLKGDPSDEFAFTTFFPEFLRPVIGTIATILGRMFCGRRPVVDNTDGHTLVVGGKPLPGSDPAEATRRRERGARALEERLAKSTGEVSAPDVTSLSDSAASLADEV